MRVQGFVVRGTGAQAVHQALANALNNYQLQTYSRWWELAPFAMRLFPKGDADVLHTTLDYGAVLQDRARPLVVTAHGYALDRLMSRYANPVQRLHYASDLRWLTRASLQRADQVVAVSQYLANLLRADLNYQGQIQVIHNGVDSALFHPGEQRPQSGPVRILFCGQLSPKKGAHLIAPVARRLGAGFEIWLTATSSELAHLVSGAAHGGAELKPIGRHSADKMPALMRQVDVIWGPSVREGFGLCVAEGMASGLPVVATDGSALPELVVSNKGGYLCPLDDADAFASSLRRLGEQPSLRREMGAFNRARVEERFSLAQMAKAYAELFESLCAS